MPNPRAPTLLTRKARTRQSFIKRPASAGVAGARQAGTGSAARIAAGALPADFYGARIGEAAARRPRFFYPAGCQWSGFDIRYPSGGRLVKRMSNPKLH